jgi:hypothetical protein
MLEEWMTPLRLVSIIRSLVWSNAFAVPAHGPSWSVPSEFVIALQQIRARKRLSKRCGIVKLRYLVVNHRGVNRARDAVYTYFYIIVIIYDSGNQERFCLLLCSSSR